jgi:hypothetical protein
LREGTRPHTPKTRNHHSRARVFIIFSVLMALVFWLSSSLTKAISARSDAVLQQISTSVTSVITVLSSTTTIVTVTTVTSEATAASTVITISQGTQPGVAILGFPWESIVLGVCIGLFTLAVLRKRVST